MTTKSAELQEQKFEFWITIVTLVVGGVVYAFAIFSYAHATFLTRSEADTRKESRDKSEQQMIKQLDRIETKLDDLLKGEKVH